MDALLLNAELMQGNDAVELINKRFIRAGHVSALSQEVGAVTLGDRHRPHAASDREKPPGQRPTEGQADGLIYISWGPNQSTLSVPLRTKTRTAANVWIGVTRRTRVSSRILEGECPR
jgi:hypothetical protein